MNKKDVIQVRKLIANDDLMMVCLAKLGCKCGQYPKFRLLIKPAIVQFLDPSFYEQVVNSETNLQKDVYLILDKAAKRIIICFDDDVASRTIDAIFSREHKKKNIQLLKKIEEVYSSQK